MIVTSAFSIGLFFSALPRLAQSSLGQTIDTSPHCRFQHDNAATANGRVSMSDFLYIRGKPANTLDTW